MRTYYANSLRQELASHCALVGLVAAKIVEVLYPEFPGWAKSAFLGGALHDPAGKMEPRFRRHLMAGLVSDVLDDGGVHIEESEKTVRFSFNGFPRHNEVSWAVLMALVKHDDVVASHAVSNKEEWEAALYSVFWHHAQPLRSEEARDKFSTLPGILEPLGRWPAAAVKRIREMLEEIGRLAGRPLNLPLKDQIVSVQDTSVPAFKRSYIDENMITGERNKRHSRAINIEAMRSAVRSAVVTADRLVSKLTAQELYEALEKARAGNFDCFLASIGISRLETIHAQIDALVHRFNAMAEGNPAALDRNAKQALAAKRLADLPIAVLQGPAGCGKTKVMLQTIRLSGARRVFILVPRTAIGEGLFKELTVEYGLTDGVELYTGNARWLSLPDGSFIETPEALHLRGNIVITTIDQVCSIALSHDRIDLLTELAASTLVFDEFHELFDLPGIVLLFMEVMRLRTGLAPDRKAHTLLISATPNPYFLAELGLDESAIVPMDSFNKRPVDLSLSLIGRQAHPFDVVGHPGDILISNSAARACTSALRRLEDGERVLCYHGNFNARDKKVVLDRVLQTFGTQPTLDPAVLCSGPIVQASLNVAARTLHAEICTADDWLQRLGRANRFAHHERTTMVTYAQTARDGSPTVSCQALRQRLQEVRARAWLSFLRSKAVWDREWTLSELYALYAEFHASSEAKKAYAADFNSVLRESVQMFKSTVFDPIQRPRQAAKGKKKLSSRSLRGSSVYALPVCVDLDAAGAVKSWRWLFNDDSDDGDALTLDAAELMLAGDIEHGDLIRSAKKAARGINKTFAEKLPKELLKQLKNNRSLKRFSVWLAMARGRDLPILTSLPWEPVATLSFERVYVAYGDVLIGAVRRRHLEEITGPLDLSSVPVAA